MLEIRLEQLQYEVSRNCAQLIKICFQPSCPSYSSQDKIRSQTPSPRKVLSQYLISEAFHSYALASPKLTSSVAQPHPSKKDSLPLFPTHPSIPSYRSSDGIAPRKKKPLKKTQMNVLLSRKRSYATSSTTPPAATIFRSASLLTHRARTRIGISGIRPLPRTLL